MEDITMDTAASLDRRETETTAGHGLGLGWLLTFSVGGAVLLFTCIGLLLSWRIKSRPENRKNSTTIYEVSDGDGNTSSKSKMAFTRRLIRRKYAMTRSTSLLTLNMPHILPPLPTYNSFNFLGGNGNRRRSRSWVEEDKFHGPKVSKGSRNSWFSRDSWIGKAPTLPTLVFDDDSEKATEDDSGPDQTLHVQKRQDKGTQQQQQQQPQQQQPQQPNSPPKTQPKPQSPQGPPPSQGPPQLQPLKTSQTAPAFTMDDFSDEGSPTRIRIPAQVLVRPSATDSDLNDILRSTEKRLLEGKNRSPVKTTPNSSPTKGSPCKTPHSQKSVDSPGSATTVGTTGTVRVNRRSTSPSKRSTIHAIPQHTQHSRNASISSIGSAAQSLLAEATQELGQMPPAQSSPTKSRGRQWEEAEIDLDLATAGHARSHSLESDESSTLSTVYSVGEHEEGAEMPNSHRPSRRHMDPFVESNASLAPKPVLYGPRSLKSHHVKKLSISTPSPPPPGDIHPALRQTSVSTQAVGGPPLFSLVLDPPSDSNDPREMEFFDSINTDNIALAFPISPSITSMVTPSVTTASDSDDVETIGPTDDERCRSQGSERLTPPERTGTSSGGLSTASSSPYNEQDMLSMLMATTASGRTLPDPPHHYGHVDQSIMPTPLSPRPRRDFSQQLRNISTASGVSSVYDEEAALDDPRAVSTGSPGRRPTLRYVKSPPLGPPPSVAASSCVGSVGNSIAELRRMNSMISSYSVASVSSSVYGDCESPTLPPFRSNSRSGNMGRQHYLNMGTPPKKEGGSRRVSGGIGAAHDSRASLAGVEIREDDREYDDGGMDGRHHHHHHHQHGHDDDDAGAGLELKEFKVLNLDFSSPPMVATGPLRETRRVGGNVGRDYLSFNRPKLGTVEELIMENQRQSGRRSVDSLGMYDNEGFLMSTPDRMNSRDRTDRVLRA